MIIYQTKDYILLAELCKYVHDVHYSLYPDYFKPYKKEDMIQFFQSIVEDEHFYFYIIEDENNPIGYVFFEHKHYKENVFRKAYQSMYIHQISISKAARNKGYGRKLMDKIISLANEKQISKIELDYWANNELAKSFYEKLGFTVYREFVYKEI